MPKEMLQLFQGGDLELGAMSRQDDVFGDELDIEYGKPKKKRSVAW